MADIPILGFAGYSKTGKTTLIEEIVRNLKKRGLRVAVIKHDVHRVVLDHEGKDSWRFTEAGADISIVSSEETTAFVEQRRLSFENLLELVHDVDIVLVEGFKSEAFTQIGIERKATKKGFPSPPDCYVALVTDDRELDADIPVFEFNETAAITEFIIKNMKGFTLLDDMFERAHRRDDE